MAQRDWLEKDYYKTLGVGSDATKEAIKSAYRKLAQKYHPDANPDDATAETRFKEIAEAHAVLANDDKRAEYDQVRAFAASGGERFYGFQPGGQGSVRINIDDLFGQNADVGSIFGDAFGFGGRRRGRDLETEVSLTFDDAIAGVTVALPQGTKARIPKGVRDGARIKIAGKGEPSQNGGHPGDMFVRVHVEAHPIFRITGNGNLELDLPITIVEAALGAKVEVPTLGDPVTVKVPAGSQHGKTLRVRGRGAPSSNGGSGDLLVKIAVEIPQKLSRKERDLLEQFAAIHDGSPREHIEEHAQRPQPRVS